MFVDTKKRAAKTVPGQFEIYVSALENSTMLKTNKGDPDDIKRQWEDLTADLNQFGSGPKKSSNEWQTTFVNWKNQVRHKARTIKTHIYQTGGGTQCDKQLSDLEERALVCWGRVAVDGAAIGDIGINTGKADDALNVENSAAPLSPTSPVSTTSSVFITVTPQTKEPAMHKSLQAKNNVPKPKQTATLIEAFEKHDQHFTDALNNLANGLEKLAVSIEETNKTVHGVIEKLVQSASETNLVFQSVIQKQNECVINLLQIIAMQKTDN